MPRRAVLLAAVVLQACRSSAPVDGGLASFIPDDAAMLAGVRLEQIKTTGTGRKLAESGWLEPAGVEARELLASWDGKNWLVAARGKLRGPSGPGLAAVDDFVVAGPPEAVRAAIGRHSAGRKPPGGLLARAREVPPDAHIWAVSWGAPQLPGDRRFSGIEKFLNAVADITATANFRDGIRAEASGTCRDEKNAEILESALRGMIGFGRMSLARREPDLLPAYDTIRVERHGTGVRLTAAIPEDAAIKLIARFTGR